MFGAQRGTGVIMTALLGGALASCGGPPLPASDAAVASAAAQPPAAPPAIDPPVGAPPAPPAVTPPVVIADPPAPPAVDPSAPPVVDPLAATPTDACAPKVPADVTLAALLDLYRAACGGVLLAVRDDGLHALTPGLAPIVRIHEKRVRWLQARRDGAVNELYYFAADAPDLVRLDLHTGREEVLVSLPRLTQPCFTGAEPGEKVTPADPVDYIQSRDSLDLDVAGGVLCLDVGDRNDNMVSLKLNFRADLRTRKLATRTVFVGEECKQGGEKPQEPACQPAPKNRPQFQAIPGFEQAGVLSPSGEWFYYLDDTFVQEGDYIYTAAFVRDIKAQTSYAVTPDGLVKIDYISRTAAKGPPEGTCYLPGEADVRWMPGRDLLILESCGAAGLLVVEPPRRVQKVDAHQIVGYP